MSVVKIAIIGDHFMLPSIFKQEILACLPPETEVDFRLLEQNWPDEAMVHGYLDQGQNKMMKGLKEYFGHQEEIIAAIGDAEILVTHLAPVSGEMLKLLPKLKCIAVARGGPVNIDMEAAHRNEVTLINVPGRNASAVAEFTIGSILSFTRHIHESHYLLKSSVWDGTLYRADRVNKELSDCVVGLIGYGNIGEKVADLLLAFGSRVLIYDPYKKVSNPGLTQLSSLSELLKTSDIVTLHARVTEETREMIDLETLSQMKSDAILVNNARGPLVNYDDLYRVLKDQQIGGAVLDTFVVEPIPKNWPLLELKNVLVTPHIAGASLKTVYLSIKRIAKDIERYLKGEKLVNQFK